MREYEQITISSNDNMAAYIEYMRKYGWVYVDSNAVGFSDHYVTGAVINGYGGFAHHNDHYVNLNLRFVRDTEMPHYKELKSLYLESNELDNSHPIVPKKSGAATGLFIFFIVLGVIELFSAIILSTSGDDSGIGNFFLILGLAFVGVFTPLLISQLVRYSKAKRKYLACVEVYNAAVYRHDKDLDNIANDKKVLDFLNKFEKSLYKEK